MTPVVHSTGCNPPERCRSQTSGSAWQSPHPSNLGRASPRYSGPSPSPRGHKRATRNYRHPRTDTLQAGFSQAGRLHALDFVYALILCHFARQRHLWRPRKDGKYYESETSSHWIQDQWNRLYQLGHFKRAHCTKRWSAIWKTLADCGLINVVDSNYWFYADKERQGKAMQWALKEQFAYHSSNTESEREIYERTTIPKYVPFRHRPTRVAPPETRSWWLGDEIDARIAQVLEKAPC